MWRVVICGYSRYIFFLARLIAVVSTCLACNSSIVAACPPIPAAHFAFRLCFIRFVFLVLVVVSGEPRRKQGRGLVDHKLVQAPQ